MKSTFAYSEQPVLVSVDQARRRLRVTATDPDTLTDLALMTQVASDSIRLYLADANDPEWDESSAPPVVQAAVLHRLGCVWSHRGDDITTAEPYEEKNWEEIARLLMQVRDPTLA
jgi:hypothetical protein